MSNRIHTGMAGYVSDSEMRRYRGRHMKPIVRRKHRRNPYLLDAIGVSACLLLFWLFMYLVAVMYG